MSDSDVESYKQIKYDLDILRQSVEKSELWVYKSKAIDDINTGNLLFFDFFMFKRFHNKGHLHLCI